MGTMRKIMEQEATTIPSTSTNHSNDVVKKVSKLEFLKLDKRLKPIIDENHQELIDSYEAAKDDWVR